MRLLPIAVICVVTTAALAACGAPPPDNTAAVESTAPTSTEQSHSAPTTPDIDPMVLGPFGYGDLTLGMTKSEAQATGLTTGIDVATPGTCGGEGEGRLAGAPTGDDLYGKLFFQDPSSGKPMSNQLIVIYAYPGVSTPEGIHLGSTYAEVKAAYPTWEDAAGEVGSHSGRGYPAVPGNPDAHYRIAIGADETVIQLSLETTGEGCYE